MYMKPRKEIPITSLKIGDSFEYFKDGNKACMGMYQIIDITPTEYLLSCFGNTTHPASASYDTIVEIEYEDKELEDMYYYQTLELIRAVNHKLPDEGDAIHEMWNVWVWETSPVDMAIRLEQEGLIILGCFELSRYAWDNDLDTGIVAEYKDTGDRIWCHTKSKWYQDWKDWFPKLWEEAMKEVDSYD